MSRPDASDAIARHNLPKKKILPFAINPFLPIPQTEINKDIGYRKAITP